MNLPNVFRRRRREPDALLPSAPAEPGRQPDSEVTETVAGERATAAVSRPPSLQSRVSNVLAAGLMGAMALGLIGWYYAHRLSDRSAARNTAQTAARSKAQGEMVLPPLGPIEPLPPSSGAVAGILGPAPDAPPLVDVPDDWLQAAELAGHEAAQPTAPTPEELALARKLSGAVFARQTSSPGLPVGAAEVVSGDAAVPAMAPEPTLARGAGGDLDALFRPSATPAVRAQVLPTETLLLPKGAFLDCTLETAIDSTLPGMTTCVTATDTFGVDGRVVLLERGTKLVGETRGQVRHGSARIFVLWTEARTPTGVVVPLLSPGTDELGRSGLPGEVNRHFFERFGAAILISVIDGAVQAAVQSQQSGDSTVIYGSSTTRDIMTEVLRSTVDIPPTVVKPQGDRIQVLVARDLDFRSVYELRPAARLR